MAIILILSISSARGQSLSVSADVMNEITYANQTDLKFGDLAPSFSNVSIEPGVTSSHNPDHTLTNTGSGAQAGLITVRTGTGGNRTISISIDSPSNLVDKNNSSNTIGFTPDHLIADGGGNSTKTITTDGGSATITTTQQNTYYDCDVYLGGSLADGAPSDNTTYTGTITLNVHY